MITPRVTRLVRVPDLKAMRSAVAELVPAADPAARQVAILVPTTAAGEELRRYLETAQLDGTGVRFMPDFVTRAGFYRTLHSAIPRAPRLLTEPDREVLLRRAAREVIDAGTPPPFRLRAGLVVQMLDFYDELRRREQMLDDFERHTVGRLEESAAIDRGAERLLQQTRFLCAAFAAFETLVHETGAIDEHGLRTLLLAGGIGQRAYRHVVVANVDQAADPRGLYASDFDLLTRMAGIRRIDVIATENMLASGFHERVHQLLPGLEEDRFGTPARLPALIAPETTEPDQRWFSWRDREEELVGLVRSLKARSGSPHTAIQPPPLDRVAVVFRRPLPYLYLARQVFGDGGIPYEAADALPLSAEPFAAMVDVLFSVLSSEANRSSLVELLSSPHLVFSGDLGPREIAALDDRLRDVKYAGGWDRLSRLASAAGPDGRPGAEALRRAGSAADALRTALSGPTASRQIAGLIGFVQQFERLPAAEEPWHERHLRARAAVLASLHALCDAHARHDDSPLDVAELTGAVRRWIEAQTFAPRIGTDGVRLLDAVAAPYADLDELHILGLVERDWPEPARRNIFYPASMLVSLGWPADASRMAAARAAFHDLLASPFQRVSASVFTLEDDAIVPPSPLVEELDAVALDLERWPAPPPARVFVHEAMQHGGLTEVATAAPSAVDWLALRRSRSPASDERFHGSTGPRDPQRYAVSYLERYLECPFKYYAARVLRLPEERDEESGLSPIERGHFIHAVFETFFREWQQGGRGAITPGNVADALTLFEAVAERKLEDLPEADRALERNHLLGSAAASGLAERAFAFEIEHGGQVRERLLEHEIQGEFTFAGADGPRRVKIRAKADRLDLMADGTIRVIDYKLSKAPKAARALQLPIYGVMAEQALDGYLGRRWTTRTAGYIAFKEREPFVPLGGGKGNGIAAAIAEGQLRLVAAVDAIERGEFPVQPDEPFRCQWCGYAGVCRKDYVGDE